MAFLSAIWLASAYRQTATYSPLPIMFLAQTPFQYTAWEEEGRRRRRRRAFVQLAFLATVQITYTLLLCTVKLLGPGTHYDSVLEHGWME